MLKKFVIISGALFSSITLLSVLFKLLHWQGASLLLIVGMFGLAVFFIPALAKYLYDKMT